MQSPKSHSILFLLILIAVITAELVWWPAIQKAARRTTSKAEVVEANVAPVAATFTVNISTDLSDSSVGDGHCDTNGNLGDGDQCTLRAAIQEANALASADVINFNLPANSVITLNSSLDFIAGDLDIIGPGANSLTIQRSTAGGTPRFRIFTILHPCTVNISGLTMTNGHVLDGVNGGDGGGVWIDLGATLNLTSVAIQGNLTGDGSPGSGGVGGGVFNFGTATITNSTISGNATGTGGSDGGAFGGYGGGIYNAGTLTLSNTTVSNNTAGNSANPFRGGYGGGIYNNGTLTATNSTISANATSGGDGGGIYSIGTLTLNSSAVYSNSAGGSGGGVVNFSSFDTHTATLNKSTISGNSAGANGGGIYNYANCPCSGSSTATATIIINNGTISGNSSGFGGGIANASEGSHSLGILTIDSGTVARNNVNTNSAGNFGGGIANHQFGATNPITLRNTIVAGNLRNFVSTDDILGPLDLSSSFDLIGDGTGMSGITNGSSGNQIGTSGVPINPLLGPLADNGGPTLTHALLVGSPAIDAGNTSQTTDQRGQPRPVDDPIVTNPAGGNASDIGAFESHNLEVNSLADESDGACTALSTGNGCTLREAINAANSQTGAEAISFAPALTAGGPAVITLLTELPSLNSDLTIKGPGSSLMTIQRSSADGTPNFRILTVNSGKVVTVSGLTITNGKVTGLFPVAAGGGIFNDHGTLTVVGCVITGNNGGGGINNGASHGGTLTVLNSTISNNTGGGIYNNIVNSPADVASLTIHNSTISGNTGTLGAGIQTSVGTSGTATALISNSTISGNSGSGNSATGGIYAAAIFGGTSTVRIYNSTITANTSDDGSLGVGGIANATSCGGGPPCSSVISLANTIVSGNFRTGIPSDISGGVDPNSSFNLIGFGGSGGLTSGTNHNQVGINPLLGLLANNGGPTMTHALLPGSVAINAGSNTNLPADTFDLNGNGNTTEPVPFDERGFARVGLGTVDIGAFESRGFTIAATGGTPQSAPIMSTFASPLSAMVSSAFGEPVSGGAVIFMPPATGPSCDFTGSLSRGVNMLLNGSGVATTPTFTANGILGGYSVTASGSGISGTANFSLTNLKASTSTSVSSSVNPSDFAQSVTFSATVSNAAGITPTGTVQFMDGVNNLGSATTCFAGAGNTCTAQFSISSLPAGNHAISASYSGDGNFNGSNGALPSGQTVKPQPSLSINDVSTTEGDAGTKTLNFTVTLSAASNLGVTVNFATADGNATAGSDYVTQSGTLTFQPGETTKTIAVTINGDQRFELDEILLVNLFLSINSTIADSQGQGTILNDDAQGGIISFSASEYTVFEADGSVTITVNRTGDTTAAATVDYATDDTGSPGRCADFNGVASSKCDFTTAGGRLQFAANETQKTFSALVNRDSYTSEIPSDAFTVKLSNLTGGAVFGTNSTATVKIMESGSPGANAIDDSTIFVRQHYHDFLNREPDASGLQFWTNEIESCGTDAACREVKRINVSGAFFLSIEFQQTGYLIERLYKTAYGNATGSSTFPSAHTLPVPMVRFNEFLADTQEIGRGVVVGPPGWEQQIENNKVAFINLFVQRQRFTNALGATSNLQFVDTLNANAGNPLSQGERDQLVADLNTSAKTRAQVLRAIAEHPTLVANEFNRAFVLMQFFGYLRRNPDDPQDHDHTGYDFWLTKLNQFGGNFQNAEMVKAFISSDEYRHRFGP